MIGEDCGLARKGFPRVRPFEGAFTKRSRISHSNKIVAVFVVEKWTSYCVKVRLLCAALHRLSAD